MDSTHHHFPSSSGLSSVCSGWLRGDVHTLCTAVVTAVRAIHNRSDGILKCMCMCMCIIRFVSLKGEIELL